MGGNSGAEKSPGGDRSSAEGPGGLVVIQFMQHLRC